MYKLYTLNWNLLKFLKIDPANLDFWLSPWPLNLQPNLDFFVNKYVYVSKYWYPDINKGTVSAGIQERYISKEDEVIINKTMFVVVQTMKTFFLFLLMIQSAPGLLHMPVKVFEQCWAETVTLFPLFPQKLLR